MALGTMSGIIFRIGLNVKIFFEKGLWKIGMKDVSSSATLLTRQCCGKEGVGGWAEGERKWDKGRSRGRELKEGRAGPSDRHRCVSQTIGSPLFGNLSHNI